MMNDEYWSDRYRSKLTGWDLGEISTPLKAYFDQLTDKSAVILIPGCGNAYEAEYLHRKGFNNVHIVDVAKEPLDNFKKRNPEFPDEHIHLNDFFKMTGEFDFIIEQTFFCALDPSMREDYVKKIHELLSAQGYLIGLLFNREFDGGPPFGGDMYEYFDYFNPLFGVVKIQPCYNSIGPREGTEVFIQVGHKI